MNQPRPQFHYYPMNNNELRKINEAQQVLQNQIQQNDFQLKHLGSKLMKQYLLKDLIMRSRCKRNFGKSSYLLIYKSSNMIIFINFRTISNINSKKRKLLQLIRKDYQRINIKIRQKKRSRSRSWKFFLFYQKRRIIQQERALINHTSMLLQQQNNVQKRKAYEMRKSFQFEIQQKQRKKRMIKDQEQKQKQQYSRRLQYMQSLANQKQASYRQYFSDFQNSQNYKLINPQLSSRQQNRNNMISKGIQQKYSRDQNQYYQKTRKLFDEKKQFREILEKQILNKQARNMEEKRRKMLQAQQNTKKLQRLKEIQFRQKEIKKQQQKKYDLQLASQVYIDDQLKTPNQVYSQKHFLKGGIHHNPITNPIGFRIDINNPYIVKQYSTQKYETVGDPNLKLNNLANIGNRSINS